MTKTIYITVLLSICLFGCKRNNMDTLIKVDLRLIENKTTALANVPIVLRTENYQKQDRNLQLGYYEDTFYTDAHGVLSINKELQTKDNRYYYLFVLDGSKSANAKEKFQIIPGYPNLLKIFVNRSIEIPVNITKTSSSSFGNPTYFYTLNSEFQGTKSQTHILDLQQGEDTTLMVKLNNTHVASFSFINYTSSYSSKTDKIYFDDSKINSIDLSY